MRVTYDQCRVLAHIDRDEYTTIERIVTATGIPEDRVRSALRSLRHRKMGGFSRNGGGYVSCAHHEDAGELYETKMWMIGAAEEWDAKQKETSE